MSSSGYGEIINEIRQIEHFKSFTCPNCGSMVNYHVLQIYATCPQCSVDAKVRGIGAIGTEVFDLIDAVLEWAGEGKSFDAVMARRHVIIEDSDNKD